MNWDGDNVTHFVTLVFLICDMVVAYSKKNVTL